MQEDHTLKFLVSVFTAGIIALLNLAVLGQVHWGWILAALLGAFLLLELYQRARRPKPPAQPKPKRRRRRKHVEEEVDEGENS